MVDELAKVNGVLIIVMCIPAILQKVKIGKIDKQRDRNQERITIK